MSDPNKSKAGLRERLQAKRRERQQKKAEAIDRARREGAMRPEDARRNTGANASSDSGFGGM
jgi:hypothetical protein